MEEQGPFDRILQAEPREQRDRAATIIVGVSIALGLILLLLVLPPISILDDDGEPAAIGPITTIARQELPPPPPGFEAVSPLYDLSAPGPVLLPARLTVPLSAAVAEGTPLLLFTYRDGEWRRLGAATVTADGSNASGEVTILPGNVAVLRPTAQTRVILGSLPRAADLDSRALAVLTTLNPTGFAPVSDGGVSGDPLQLPPDLPTAVAPTISALTPPQIATLNAILVSPDLRTAHAQAILTLARDGDFAGIDLDYQTIDPSLESDFVALVQEISAGLRAEGRSLSLSLPLPDRQGDEWDTLGFDWQALAPLVDAIKLAPERDPDRYYERTEEALAFLVSRVPSSKLLLVVTPYSHERNVLGMRMLTLTEALSLASTPVAELSGPVASEATVQAVGQNLADEMGASGLRWDDRSLAVVFSYAGLGGERTIWIANVFSEAFKLDLASRYRLGGVAVTDVSQSTGDANIWPALQQYADTGDVELVKPNGELLQPRWTASGGTLESATGASVNWRAPAEAGVYTLTLIVSDGVMHVGQRLRLEVASPVGAVSP